MRDPDGTYSINGDELAALIAGQEVWWLLPGGATTTTADHTPPVPDALYLMSFSQSWVDQWDGDLRRACAEQLNPTLAAFIPNPPELEEP